MKISGSSTKLDLMSLHAQFEKLFQNKIDYELFTSICGKFSLFILKVYTKDSNVFLENFVKEYFVMEKQIVDDRNNLIDYVQSENFKDETLMNKLKIKHKLNKAQNMCERVNLFEKEFYEKVGISLLRVENERCAREKAETKENHEQEIEQ